MADTQDASAAQATSLLKEAERRLKSCGEQRRDFEEDYREAAKFVMPHGVRDFSGQTAMRRQKPDDAYELFSSIARAAHNDFSSDVVNTFLPRHAKWAKAEAGIRIPEDQKDRITQQIGGFEKSVFDAMAASSLYDVAPQFMQHLSIGTGGIWIQDLGAATPLHCEVVPFTELKIGMGPYGGIDIRFWEKPVPYADLPDMFPGRTFHSEIQAKIKDKSTAMANVTRGGWRIWSDPGVYQWRYIVMIDCKDMVESTVLRGSGCFPLIIGRWNPCPGLAYGIGPTLDALADIRTDDELAYVLMEGLDRVVNPAIVYPDDGMLNFGAGIGGGYAFPSLPGSARDIKTLELGGRLDHGYFSQTEYERRIRRLFFQDKPFQRGATPPSASQWLGEATEKQQRLGAPAAPLWSESISEIWMRFAYLEQIRQGFAPIKLNDGSIVLLRPINPVIRGQKEEEVLQAVRIMGIIVQNYGLQMAMALVDPETITNIKSALGDELVKLRDADEIAMLIGQFLAAGTATGAPGEAVGALGA